MPAKIPLVFSVFLVVIIVANGFGLAVYREAYSYAVYPGMEILLLDILTQRILLQVLI